MADNPAQFGKISYAAIETGALLAMKGRAGEFAVYLAIAAHVQGKGWTARPSIDRLTKLTGLDRRTVQRATRLLEAKGLIVVHDDGGKGVANTYEVTTGAA